MANVSHELRTPLTSIQGFVEAILDGVVTDKEAAKHYLQIVLDETKRLNRLVSDLLDLSRLESGELPLKLETLYLNPSWKTWLKQSGLLPATRKSSWSWSLEPSFAPVKADRGQDRRGNPQPGPQCAAVHPQRRSCADQHQKL